MYYQYLLAKRAADPGKPEEGQTLLGHTKFVIRTMSTLKNLLSEAIQELIQGEISGSAWQDCALAAAWLHDLGKANDHFQRMLRDPRFRQGARHETLGLIVIDDLLAPWLKSFWDRHPPWLQAAVYFAVAGHHLKFPDLQARGGQEITFLGSHPDLRNILELGAHHLQLGSPPALSDRSYSLLTFGGLRAAVSSLKRRLAQDFSDPQKLVIAALKTTLMVADLAGSTLPVHGQDIPHWLVTRLQIALEPQALENLVSKKIGKQSLRPFQQEVQESDSSTILLQAGCGAGKTAAAYLWAAKNAAGRRLFFCYPTTTTASEGFSGYLQEPDFEAILIHCRAQVDYRLLDYMPEPTKSEAELRALQLEALDTWPIPAVVCTAHTVLGLLQNTRRGLYAWPSLLRAAFVFDEIHSYSPRLFQHLLRFLQVFRHAPILLMTATLPPIRFRALQQICNERGGLIVIAGPPERERAKRYILKRSDEASAWQQAQETLQQGGKVLWIVNTVARCVAQAKMAAAQGLPVQPFHSRYRYRDRLVRQQTVIAGFAPGKPALLAVTTQVAEISLDLSADLLITELAPIPALIQRLGRLNRFAHIPDDPKPALFVTPPDPRPYSQEEYDEPALRRWLELVADGKPKSQQELSAAFCQVSENVGYDADAAPLHCDWLDDPWSSLSGRHALMEPSYTLEVVRQEDLALGSLGELALPLPIPKGKAWQQWQFQGRYAIAPSGTVLYDPFWGGEYAREHTGFEII